jgi:hypothetical protein
MYGNLQRDQTTAAIFALCLQCHWQTHWFAEQLVFPKYYQGTQSQVLHVDPNERMQAVGKTTKENKNKRSIHQPTHL